MPNYIQATVNQAWQMGIEGTPGNGLSANHIAQSWNVVPTEEFTTAEFHVPGRRFVQGVDPEQEWTSFQYSGMGLYTEALFALECMFGTIAPTSSGTKTKTRVYVPSLSGPMNGKTLVFQWGDANNVYQINYGVLADFGMKFDRKAGITFSGSGFGQKQTAGNTFAVSPTFLTKQRMLGKHINYYLDTASGSLGTTQQQLTVMGADFDYKGGYVPFWDSDRGQTSWAVPVDAIPTYEVKLRLVENANTRTINNALVLGNTYFLRIDTQDSVNSIETGHAFTLDCDFALQLKQKGAFGDQDSVLYREFTFTVVEDTGWGKATQFTSITDVASL